MHKKKGNYGFSHGSRSRGCSLAKKKGKKKRKGNEENAEEKASSLILSKLRDINVAEITENRGMIIIK